MIKTKKQTALKKVVAKKIIAKKIVAKKAKTRSIASVISPPRKIQKSETKVAPKNKKTIWEKINAVIKGGSRVIAWVLAIVVSVLIVAFIYVNLPAKAKTGDVKMGVTFSYIYAAQIGLDWKEVYLAMMDDLKIKHVRLPVYWDRVEKEEGKYDFSEIDWQLAEAQKRGVDIIMVIGQKVPRWPECYVPTWVGSDPSNLPAERLKEKLLTFEEVVINRYKDNHPEIIRWQVENEPFLDFGICSKVGTELLDSELAMVRRLDPSRPIMVTDSGELSLWINAAKRADVFGTTMYREVYSAEMGHWRYPIGPNFFKIKQQFIKLFANQDNAVVIELQGEPWVAGWTIDAPIEVQLASMNAEKLVENFEFAKKTGMKEIYIWGVEWWYWMKINQNNSTLWESARIFSGK
jgi:hypothetical protein